MGESVTEAIEYEQFDQGAQPSGPSGADADLSRLSDIPMELSVEIGRTHMTVGETLDLRVGSVVTLERLAGETADLLVNGTAIARGEVVVIDEQYGLRVTEILDRQEGELQPPAIGSAGETAGSGEEGETPSTVAAAAVEGSGEG
jgi:flagellar motor switch protein FliN